MIAYFDCFHGAAGDMLLASLLDAGLPLDDVRAALAGLPLAGYRLLHEPTTSHGVRGSRLRVRVDVPQPARSWAAIRTLLAASPLPEQPRAAALGVFERLARAEARIHSVPVDEVHFHELGAVDSIVDTVGVCLGLHLLGVARVYASALPTGHGWVTTAHGELPVPAPATLAVLAEVGAPLLPGPTMGELLTPTAAALLAELATFAQPPMQVTDVGYGFGTREIARLNGLRVWLGQPMAAAPADATHEPVIELRCNLDDATGELVGHTIARLLAAGALDAWAAPLTMKKGRPGLLLACLAHPPDAERLAALLLAETPTLGVRWHRLARLAAARAHVEVATPWGPVRVKQKWLDATLLACAPEYDDCARLAAAHNVPLAQVYAAALAAAHALA